jgi:large subunit ribosomal protein L6
MSRVGKKPIPIPEGVEVKIEENTVTIKGPKGEISQEIRPEIRVEVKENKIFVLPQKDYNPPSASSHKWAPTKQTKALWGLTRALIANMITGVIGGFEKKLEIQGIGFRAVVEGEELLLYVGYSQPVKIKIPQDLKISVEKNIITVSGIDKKLVGQMAAVIRKVKPPEPYKGKGIRYLGEQIRRKVGKKVVTAG